MARFNPYTQAVSFFGSDGQTPINVGIPNIDAFNKESVSISINYGSQLGACIIMLLVLLIMTPSMKFRRLSTILNGTALLTCIVRMGLLSAFFVSPFNDFYNYWAADYTSVSLHHYQVSVAGNVFSLLLVINVEAALMNQAWAMVSLWKPVARYTLSALSGVVTMMTISWRLAYTIVLSRAVFAAESARPLRWVVQWTIITNSVSICWFCALFNARLVLHLATHRRVLPSYRNLTPMEALIMTNGLLMIVPVIFTGLEWGHWSNFEAASLTLTSVTLILPLGTLAAQRLSQSYGLKYENSTDRSHTFITSRINGSHKPLKASSSFTVGSRTDTAPQISISSRCEAMISQRGLDPVDIELGRIDNCNVHIGHVRVDRGFEQREERV